MNYIYVLAKKKRGDLFVGVTRNLSACIEQLRSKADPASLPLLVYYEQQPDEDEAKGRRDVLRNWNTEWKNELVEDANPRWQDLYPQLKAG